LNEALEDVGISYAQYEVLETLAEDLNHHAASIAAHLATTRQAVSLLVRRLCDAGLVAPLTWDQGVRGLRITRGGTATLERCAYALAGLHRLLERMSKEDRARLLESLNAAEAALRPPPLLR
jgi:DNA-binding MarR family transcriptional regulator